MDLKGEKNMEEENVKVENEKVIVDFIDEKLELDREVASKVVHLRDKYKSVLSELREIRDKEKSASLARAEAERKAQAIEAMKNEDIEKVKELLSKEYQDKISRYEAKTFRQSIENSVRKVTDLIDGAADDVISSIFGSNRFTLTDDFVVQNEDGKCTDDLVKEYIDARPYLKKAKGNKPLQNPIPKEKPAKSGDLFRDGLNKFLTNRYGR